MSDLLPPSANLIPPAPALRERLAVALREVDLLRRLIRAADSIRLHTATDRPTAVVALEAKGGIRE